MPKHYLAIATCRVSSIEQLESNSLNRQTESVMEAAKYLGVTIPADGLWSGSVSSKSGSNYSRKDLNAMLDYCKTHPNVKYLIVDEIDRFMRSIDEMFYFEVLFRERVQVKVWYAGDPALNSDDPLTKLRRAMEAFKAEGSNLERQIKSIKGQTAALEHGRYPFAPKPGYKRGYEVGIPEVHPVRGPILKDVLIRIVTKLVTPTQGLIELNNSEFMVGGHSPYKMDKFRRIVTDPFYAGVVEIDKQVKVRNEHGLHEPLITMEQHKELVRLMDDKPKTQSGPRKNGNPKYPVSNLINCYECRSNRIGRLVGYDHTNGKPNSAIYEKYRCRSCGRLQHRSELHPKIEQQFKDNPVSEKGINELLKALDIVWRQREGQAEQETYRIRHKIKTLNIAVSQQVEAATDPSNSTIKDEILAAIEGKKAEVIELERQLEAINSEADNDRGQFLSFAFDFVSNMGDKFLDPDIVSRDNRLRCKDVMFPAGFWIDKNNKVYTPEVSELIRLANSNKNHLVRVTGL